MQGGECEARTKADKRNNSRSHAKGTSAWSLKCRLRKWNKTRSDFNNLEGSIMVGGGGWKDEKRAGVESVRRVGLREGGSFATGRVRGERREVRGRRERTGEGRGGEGMGGDDGEMGRDGGDGGAGRTEVVEARRGDKVRWGEGWRTMGVAVDWVNIRHRLPPATTCEFFAKPQASLLSAPHEMAIANSVHTICYSTGRNKERRNRFI